MAKWDITVSQEVLDTIEAEEFRVESGAAVFYSGKMAVAVVGLGEGVVVKLATGETAQPAAEDYEQLGFPKPPQV